MEQSAPLGHVEGSSRLRACAVCVKAKSKCLPQPDLEGICQRCYRLKKQCLSYERPSRKRTRKPTRVAQMEQKLDGLVTLLTSGQSTLQAIPPSQAASESMPRSPISMNPNASTTGPSTTRASSKGFSRPTVIAQPVSLSSGTARVDLACCAAAKALSAEADEREAERILFEFKANMAEQFPFVIVHPDTTSQFLPHDRPLLWKAIMVAASHGNSDRQLALGAEMIEDLTTRLLFRAEKSLDLLQALLVFIAWYHYHILVNPQITNLLHLTKALINNMGLNRAQTANDRGKFFLDGCDLAKSRSLPSNGSNSRSDEWRALAGCFYVACTISASCRGLELQFDTLYILECCQKLEEAKEHQSDILLVQLTRLQEIRYRMGRSFPYDDPNASRKSDAPIEMLVRAWQMELEAFWVSLPAISQQNRLLLATYHTAKIALYEIDMSDCTRCIPRTAVKFKVDKKGRLEFIHASLLATRKVFDVYASIPVERLPSVCLTLWLQFHHALLNAIKLLTTDVDGWEHATTLLKFPDILHSQVKAIEEVISNRGLKLETAVDERDVFVKFLAKIHYITRWYESLQVSKLEPRVVDDQLPDSGGLVEATGIGEILPVLDDSFWQNFLDDDWALVGDGLGL